MTENNTNIFFKYSTNIELDSLKRIEKTLEINSKNGNYSNDKYQIKFDFDTVFIKFAESDHQFIRDILNKITGALELQDEYKFYKITNNSTEIEDTFIVFANEENPSNQESIEELSLDSDHSSESESSESSFTSNFPDYCFDIYHNLPGKDFLFSANDIKAKFIVTILRKITPNYIPCYIVDIESTGSYTSSKGFIQDNIKANIKLNNLKIDSDNIDLLKEAISKFDDDSIFKDFSIIIMNYFSSLLEK